MSRTLKLVCASALILGLSSPAFAQRSQERVVEYGDVDGYTADGADEILNRVESAAEQVCGDRSGPMPIPERQGIAACTYETVDIAVADMGHPGVTARYHGYDPEVVIEEEGSASSNLSPKG